MPSIALSPATIFFIIMAAFLFWGSFIVYKQLSQIRYRLSNLRPSKRDPIGPVPQKDPPARYHQQMLDMGFRVFAYELFDEPYVMVGPAWYYTHEDFQDFFVQMSTLPWQGSAVFILTQFKNGACIQTNYLIPTEAYESDAFSCNYASHSLESTMEYHHRKALSWREKHGEFVHVQNLEDLKVFEQLLWSKHMPAYVEANSVSSKPFLALILLCALGSLLSGLAIMFSPEDISGPIIAMWAIIIVIGSIPYRRYLVTKVRPLDAELSRPLGLHTLWPRKSKS